ncbi:hypothetical protein PybrP1_001333 [[Pythium] brassicae (nom. inval.)]|nr:hypothetical protein PybrP1_001333 [[Pythium] brassicae (nom. inval.)]
MEDRRRVRQQHVHLRVDRERAQDQAALWTRELRREPVRDEQPERAERHERREPRADDLVQHEPHLPAAPTDQHGFVHVLVREAPIDDVLCVVVAARLQEPQQPRLLVREEIGWRVGAEHARRLWSALVVAIAGVERRRRRHVRPELLAQHEVEKLQRDLLPLVRVDVRRRRRRVRQRLRLRLLGREDLLRKVHRVACAADRRELVDRARRQRARDPEEVPDPLHRARVRGRLAAVHVLAQRLGDDLTQRRHVDAERVADRERVAQRDGLRAERLEEREAGPLRAALVHVVRCLQHVDHLGLAHTVAAVAAAAACEPLAGEQRFVATPARRLPGHTRAGERERPRGALHDALDLLVPVQRQVVHDVRGRDLVVVVRPAVGRQRDPRRHVSLRRGGAALQQQQVRRAVRDLDVLDSVVVVVGDVVAAVAFAVVVVVVVVADSVGVLPVARARADRLARRVRRRREARDDELVAQAPLEVRVEARAPRTRIVHCERRLGREQPVDRVEADLRRVLLDALRAEVHVLEEVLRERLHNVRQRCTRTERALGPRTLARREARRPAGRRERRRDSCCRRRRCRRRRISAGGRHDAVVAHRAVVAECLDEHRRARLLAKVLAEEVDRDDRAGVLELAAALLGVLLDVDDRDEALRAAHEAVVFAVHRAPPAQARDRADADRELERAHLFVVARDLRVVPRAVEPAGLVRRAQVARHLCVHDALVHAHELAVVRRVGRGVQQLLALARDEREHRDEVQPVLAAREPGEPVALGAELERHELLALAGALLLAVAVHGELPEPWALVLLHRAHEQVVGGGAQQRGRALLPVGLRGRRGCRPCRGCRARDTVFAGLDRRQLPERDRVRGQRRCRCRKRRSDCARSSGRRRDVFRHGQGEQLLLLVRVHSHGFDPERRRCRRLLVVVAAAMAGAVGRQRKDAADAEEVAAAHVRRHRRHRHPTQ